MRQPIGSKTHPQGGNKKVRDMTAEEDYQQRRMAGKQQADNLRENAAKNGNELDWFEDLYQEAHGDPAKVPWGDMVPRPEFVSWLDALPAERKKGRALDVGCGLGDNAAYMADVGFEVTAFDLSLTGVQWAAQRFPDKGIDWQQANLFDLLPLWDGMFDLVHETYTVQALRGADREKALRALVPLVKEGGTLFVLCRSVENNEVFTPPPWPLKPEELNVLTEMGLTEVSFERLGVESHGRTIPHFRVEYRK